MPQTGAFMRCKDPARLPRRRLNRRFDQLLVFFVVINPVIETAAMPPCSCALLKGSGRAFKTMEKYTYVLKKLQTWWEKRGDKAASRFTVHDFYAFKAQLERDGMSPKTIADRMMIVRQLLKWASEKAKPHRLLPTNPISGEPLMEAKSPQQPCFTPEQVRLLLDNANPILKPIFATMAYTGLRFGEVTVPLRHDCTLAPVAEREQAATPASRPRQRL